MMSIGSYELSKEPVIINEGRSVVTVQVKNTGDRPIQIGSHFHFFETNRALAFDRSKTLGRHLNIPAGTAVRFEPGDQKSVELVEYAGQQIAWGFNDLVNGSVKSDRNTRLANDRVAQLGFKTK